MTLVPRSLFGRLALLLLAVVAVALVATIFFFRQDRMTLLARQFGDTKIVQLQAVRAALEANDTPERRESIGRIGREYDVRIVPESERPFMGGVRAPQQLEALEARLRKRLAPAQSCARPRAAACFWCGSKPPAPATGSAFRFPHARRPRTIRRARHCGA